jgi:hypothetical protein
MASGLPQCSCLDGEYLLAECTGPHSCAIQMERRTHRVNSHGLDPFPGSSTFREVWVENDEDSCRWQTAWGSHDGALPRFEAISSDDHVHVAVRGDGGPWTIINLPLCIWVDTEQVGDRPDWSKTPTPNQP